jgi:hypothetical protein
MDPETCLQEAEIALNEGKFSQADFHLIDYRRWRMRGGFEPENGDERARHLSATLVTKIEESLKTKLNVQNVTFIPTSALVDSEFCSVEIARLYGDHTWDLWKVKVPREVFDNDAAIVQWLGEKFDGQFPENLALLTVYSKSES